MTVHAIGFLHIQHQVLSTPQEHFHLIQPAALFPGLFSAMHPHALSQDSYSPPTDTPDLPDARSLKRCLSNLSQASTLVGSESDDIDIAQRRLSTAAQYPVTDEITREHDAEQPCTLDQTDIDSELQAEYRVVQTKVIEVVKALHVFCYTIMDVITRVNIKMGEAERLLEGGERLTAHYLFRDIIRDIDALVWDGLDLEGIHCEIEQDPL